MRSLVWQRPTSNAACMLAVLMSCDPEGHVGFWSASPPPTAAGSNAPDGEDQAATIDDPAAAAGDAAVRPPSNGGATGPGTTAPSATDVCAVARSGQPALEVTVVDTNAVVYNFAQGAVFPPGRYRISYVDGCRKYDDTEAWTLHGSVLAIDLALQGRGGCYLVVSDDREALGLAPGTSGLIVGEGPDPAGAFASYDECVAANLKLAAFDFSFSGGTLGIQNTSDTSPDKTSGEAIGRRSPTYRLARLDDCP